MKQLSQVRAERGLIVLLACTAFTPGDAAAREESTFRSYVDSDVCAHLMLGPIDAARVQCSQQTHKEGSDPVLVRLSNNAVYEVNKNQMIKDHVGEFAEVSGELNVKDSRIKLHATRAFDPSSIKPGDPANRLLGARTSFKGNVALTEEVRHNLAILPYTSEFDFITFVVLDREVILSGWTVRTTNRRDAEGVVREIAGVQRVVNNIEVLPLGSMDM